MAPRRRASTHVATAQSPKNVEKRPCQWIIQVSVSPPLKLRRWTTSPVPDDPGCGPDAVTTVPRKRTHAAMGKSDRVASTTVRSLAAAASGSWRERQASDTAPARMTIESRKWPITHPGASP